MKKTVIILSAIILVLVIALIAAVTALITNNPDTPNENGEITVVDENAEERVPLTAVLTDDLQDIFIKNTLIRIRQEEEEFERLNNPYYHVIPDETGRVFCVMFHGFVREYTGGDRSITTTLDEFRLLLERLYGYGYRTVSLTDFIEGNINIPKGTKPIVFTFDDGRASQFSFIRNEDGTFSDNPDTAVYVMEQFYREFPDFGLNGTFFLNLGFENTFGTVGTFSERVNAVINKGFEIGNHSYNHENLGRLNTPEEIMEAMGRNAKMLNEINPNHKMETLALPYGITNRELSEYIISGVFEGYEYHNKGIMLVGAEPAQQLYMKGADPARIRRVMASGMDPVDWDLTWWLDNLRDTRIYISDGSPYTVTVPERFLNEVDTDKIEALGKRLVVIDNEGNQIN
jgi:peptidoglycan/xylan/chitin deacetylase (PgdA/CDA1 family)